MTADGGHLHLAVNMCWPYAYIFWESKAGQLVELKIPGASWARLVGLSRRRKGSMNPTGRLLVEVLRRVARETFSG